MLRYPSYRQLIRKQNDTEERRDTSRDQDGHSQALPRGRLGHRPWRRGLGLGHY